MWTNVAICVLTPGIVLLCPTSGHLQGREPVRPVSHISQPERLVIHSANAGYGVATYATWWSHSACQQCRQSTTQSAATQAAGHVCVRHKRRPLLPGTTLHARCRTMPYSTTALLIPHLLASPHFTRHPATSTPTPTPKPGHFPSSAINTGPLPPCSLPRYPSPNAPTSTSTPPPTAASPPPPAPARAAGTATYPGHAHRGSGASKHHPSAAAAAAPAPSPPPPACCCSASPPP